MCAKAKDSPDLRREFALAVTQCMPTNAKDFDALWAELYLLKPDWLSALVTHALLQKVLPVCGLGSATLPIDYRPFDAQVLSSREIMARKKEQKKGTFFVSSVLPNVYHRHDFGKRYYENNHRCEKVSS